MSNDYQIATRKDNAFQYRVMNLLPISEIISWLGEDFIMLTNGEKVTYSGVDIAYGEDMPAEPLKRVMLVFRNPIRNNIAVATVGDVIIKDTMVGYYVMSTEKFAEFFTVDPPVMPDGE